jgi:hypothetical protein
MLHTALHGESTHPPSHHTLPAWKAPLSGEKTLLSKRKEEEASCPSTNSSSTHLSHNINSSAFTLQVSYLKISNLQVCAFFGGATFSKLSFRFFHSDRLHCQPRVSPLSISVPLIYVNLLPSESLFILTREEQKKRARARRRRRREIPSIDLNQICVEIHKEKRRKEQHESVSDWSETFIVFLVPRRGEEADLDFLCCVPHNWRRGRRKFI